MWSGDENTLEPVGTSVCLLSLTISNHDEIQSVTAAASCLPSKFPNSHKLLIGLARALNHREGDLRKCNSSSQVDTVENQHCGTSHGRFPENILQINQADTVQNHQ